MLTQNLHFYFQNQYVSYGIIPDQIVNTKCYPITSETLVCKNTDVTYLHLEHVLKIYCIFFYHLKDA